MKRMCLDILLLVQITCIFIIPRSSDTSTKSTAVNRIFPFPVSRFYAQMAVTQLCQELRLVIRDHSHRNDVKVMELACRWQEKARCMIAVFKKKCNRWQENAFSFADILIAVMHILHILNKVMFSTCNALYVCGRLSVACFNCKHHNTILRNSRIYRYEEVGVNRMPSWVIPSWKF